MEIKFCLLLLVLYFTTCVMTQTSTTSNFTATALETSSDTPSQTLIPSSTKSQTNQTRERIAPTSPKTIETTGFSTEENPQPRKETSWLRTNNRFVFIIVFGLVFFVLLAWYAHRSIKGMRKRLMEENSRQEAMLQQLTANTHHVYTSEHKKV